jgi:hypothetical protein
MPYTHPLQEQAGLKTTDKLRHTILLNAALQTEWEMEDYKWHRNKWSNHCPGCKQPAYFLANFPIPYHACTDSTCIVADNHKNYDSASCITASTFVAYHLEDKDRAIYMAQEEDQLYWHKQAMTEFEAMFRLAENEGELQYEWRLVKALF